MTNNTNIRPKPQEQVSGYYKTATIILAAIVLILGTIVITSDSKSELERTRKLLDTCNTYNLNPNFIKPEGAI